MENKEEIRKRLIAERDAMSQEKWQESSKAIEKKIIKSDIYKQADCILIYADFHGEVGTITLIEDALIKGKKVYLPKVHEDYTQNRMDFYEIFSTYELLSGYKGIMEPLADPTRCFKYGEYSSKKVLMLVPGVAFDKNGNRLGYGKGYYDNYLSDKPSILSIGLCFAIQLMDEIPVNERDVKLDYVITENTQDSFINEIKYRG